MGAHSFPTMDPDGVKISVQFAEIDGVQIIFEYIERWGLPGCYRRVIPEKYNPVKIGFSE